VANKLLEKAEVALTAEQLETAITVLEQARDVSPDNARLKFLDGQVARERERLKLTQAQDTSKKVRSLLAAAQEDIDGGRLVSPGGNNAREAIAEARRTDPTDPAIAQAQRTLNTRTIEAARRAAEQNQTEQAQNLLTAARQMGAAGADLTAVERLLTAETRPAVATPSQPAVTQQQATVSTAQQQAAAAAEAARKKAEAEAAAAQVLPPKRIKTVPPTSPKEATSRGLSGWVVVSFTIMQNGLVGDVKVAEAQPKGVFDDAAIQAVSQWRYEPPVRADGKPATLGQKIKLKFDN
jgi:protein TonB